MDDHSHDAIIDPEIVPSEVQPGKRRSRVRLALIGTGVVAFFGVGAYVIITEKQKDAIKVADMVRNHPIVIEHLGGIDECTWNTFASLNEGGKRTSVFDVRGPKGSGRFVTFELLFKFRSIILRTPDGEWELLDDGDGGG